MQPKNGLLQAAEKWYGGPAVKEILARTLPRDGLFAWYEASRIQQLDGSFLAKYYVCTRAKLLVLSVSALQFELRTYSLAALQKMTARIPFSAGHRAVWPRTEFNCRFLVGSESELVQVDFPERNAELPGYFSIVELLLDHGG
ncbi:MAG: hypothetical protein AB1441_03515 [Bacillota bacterium]